MVGVEEIAGKLRKILSAESSSSVEECAVKFVEQAKLLEGEFERESGVSSTEAALELKSICQLVLRRALLEEGLARCGYLVDLSVTLALSHSLVSNEVPFLLFEDLFQSIPVASFESGWGLLEDRTRVLTCKDLLPYHKVTKSKMAMLRIANYMLRRLSASQHTVLCGRVMMFLAYAFPLSERSGVNLLGAYNEENQTDFEDRETFDSFQTAEMDEEEGKSINYVLYSKFWQLQKYFVTKVDNAQSGCISSADNWEEFAQLGDVVLAAFEAKPFSSADLDRERLAFRESKRRRLSSDDTATRDVEMTDATKERNEFFATKYLSSSRLLRLQLSDPTLRRNVLVQFMFLLETIHRVIKSQAVKLSSTLRVKLSDSTTGLEGIKSRVIKLLRATPPDGDSFLMHLEHFLSREEHWVDWKLAKCPDFEKSYLSKDGGEEEDDGDDGDGTEEQEAARKRAKASQLSRANERIKRNRTLWRSKVDDWRVELSNIENPRPEFAGFIRSMEIAIDPDNCIEDEYHPKHDSVYCWQGLRLLARENLEAMQKVDDGSLEQATIRLVNPSSKGHDQTQEEDVEQDTGATETEKADPVAMEQDDEESNESNDA